MAKGIYPASPTDINICLASIGVPLDNQEDKKEDAGVDDAQVNDEYADDNNEENLS